MPSNLHQMQLTYDQLHDRLVLVLYTQDLYEYRFWITRRALKILWDILQQLLEADKKGRVQHMKESQKAADKIQQEKSQHQPAADQYATKVTRRPFGEEPLLLFKIIAKPIQGGILVLHLEDQQGRSIEFGGDSTIVVGLCQLIQQTIKQADWNLNLTETA